MGLVIVIAPATTVIITIVVVVAITADSATEEPSCPTSSISCPMYQMYQVCVCVCVCVCLFSSDFTYKTQNLENGVIMVLN